MSVSGLQLVESLARALKIDENAILARALCSNHKMTSNMTAVRKRSIVGSPDVIAGPTICLRSSWSRIPKHLKIIVERLKIIVGRLNIVVSTPYTAQK